MILAITKNNHKKHVISYRRDDGSTTWMLADDYFVRHDLSHYAIEKTLNYKTGFMGMLNNGMEIADFEDRGKRMEMVITKEAWHAENIANLFLMELSQGMIPDFNAVSAATFAQMNKKFPSPVLTDDDIASIRVCLGTLINDWQRLPEGQSMHLNLEL